MSINENLIVNSELASFFNMKDASPNVDAVMYIVDVVVYCSHLVKPFSCGGRAEFVVVIEECGAWIKDVEASAYGEFVGSGGYDIVGKFSKR